MKNNYKSIDNLVQYKLLNVHLTYNIFFIRISTQPTIKWSFFYKYSKFVRISDRLCMDLKKKQQKRQTLKSRSSCLIHQSYLCSQWSVKTNPFSATNHYSTGHIDGVAGLYIVAVGSEIEQILKYLKQCRILISLGSMQKD